MSEHSFFVSPTAIQGRRADLGGQVAHQIRSVLRLRPGDRIDLLDGSGIMYVARILEISRSGVVAEVLESRRPATEPRVELELYQAMLKGPKMELVLQKGTEVGISRFVPVLSERCVSRPDPSDLHRRLERWRAIVREAAEQSGRALLPAVESVESFDEACRAAREADLAMMAWEEERGAGIRGAIRERGLAGDVPPASSRSPSVGEDVLGRRRRVALLVGPEGGFSPREADVARDSGIRVVSLGPRILRAETAALVASALVLYEVGDLGG